MVDVFDEPIVEGFRVLMNCGDSVIQIAKIGEVTDHTTREDREYEVHTYPFIRVERNLSDAAGDEYIKEIFSATINGRLYRKLRKMAKGWEGRHSIEDRLHDVATHKQSYCTQKDEPKEFLEFLTEFQGLKAVVDIEARKALLLRRDIREAMEDNFFGRETLYRTMVKNQRVLCDLRKHLQFIERETLYGDDGKLRDEQIWETRRIFDTLPGVSSCRELDQAVCISFGAVSPESMSPEAIYGALKCCGGTDTAPEDPRYKDIVLEACIMYGSFAPIEEKCFLDERDGLQWAKDVFSESKFMLGFMLDRTCNAIGASGWDFLRGDPTRRGEDTDE